MRLKRASVSSQAAAAAAAAASSPTHGRQHDRMCMRMRVLQAGVGGCLARRKARACVPKGEQQLMSQGGGGGCLGRGAPAAAAAVQEIGVVLGWLGCDALRKLMLRQAAKKLVNECRIQF